MSEEPPRRPELFIYTTFNYGRMGIPFTTESMERMNREGADTISVGLVKSLTGGDHAWTQDLIPNIITSATKTKADGSPPEEPAAKRRRKDN